jgi:hypothetical protein
VFGALVIIYLFDRLWYRQLRLRQVAIPIIVGLAITMIWYFYQSFQTAANQAGQAVILDRFGAQISLFSFPLIIRSVRVLLSSGVLIWGLPGLVYGLYKSRERDILGIQRGFLLTFCFLWFFWFIFGSISWLRYAFPAISIMILFIAKLLVDLADDFIFTRWRQRSADGTHIDQSRLVKSLAVTVAIALMVFVPLEVRLKDILTPSATSPTDFAVYLQQMCQRTR